MTDPVDQHLGPEWKKRRGPQRGRRIRPGFEEPKRVRISIARGPLPGPKPTSIISDRWSFNSIRPPPREATATVLPVTTHVLPKDVRGLRNANGVLGAGVDRRTEGTHGREFQDSR